METSKAKSVIYAEMRKHTGDLADALKVAHKALCHVEKEERSQMQITAERLTTWSLVKSLALATVSKAPSESEPSSEWKTAMLRCEHSPIRALMFKVEMRDIPYYVSVHLSRHKVGVEHYVSTQRTDRTGEDRDSKRQDAPVNHTMIVNAAALIAMSRKRLCKLADPRTRDIWGRVREAIAELGEKELHCEMRPECHYRNGVCPEFRPCYRKG